MFSFPEVEGDLDGEVVACCSVEDFFNVLDEFELLSWDEEMVELIFLLGCWVYPGVVAAVVLEVGRCCSQVKLA